MSFSLQSQHRICIGDEAIFGEVPVPANLRQVRFSGTELGFQRKSIESDEIRSDRQIAHLIPGLEMVEGDLDFELSYGAFDDLLAGVLMGEWSGNVLKTGTKERSFVIERGFTDIEEYQVFSGCVIDELSLTIQPESLVGGRFGVIGRQMQQSGSSLDTTPTAPSTLAPISNFQAKIWEGGSLLAHVTGIDFKITNGTERAYSVGSEAAAQLIPGLSRVTGSLSAFFESDSLIQKMLGRTESALEIRLSGEGGGYHILLPKIHYLSVDIPVKGERAVIMTLPFTAVFDPSESTNIKITRIPD